MGVLPLLIATAVIYTQRVNVIKTNQFQKLRGIRDLKIKQLNSWIDERVGNVKTIIEDEFFIEYVTGDYHNEPKILEILQKYVENYSSWDEMYIVSTETGKIILSTNYLKKGIDISNENHFLKTLETKKIFINSIHFDDKISNHPTMSISGPIMKIENGIEQVFGVLVAHIDLDKSLYKLLLDRTGMGRTGETLIVNKGQIALNELRYYENAPLKLHISAEPAARAASGFTGIIEVNDYREEPVLAAYAYIPIMDWGFVAKQDQAEVFVPINQMLMQLFVVVFASIIGIYFFSFLVVRITTRSITSMVKVSTQLGEGDLSARNEIKSIDETALLANSINVLAESIEYQIDLKDRIATISDNVVKAVNLSDLSKNLLETITELTDSDLGLFYSLDKNKSQYKLLASAGSISGTLKPFNASLFKGEFGPVLSTKQIVVLKNIPEDTIHILKSMTGTRLPKEIIYIPVLVKKDVAGIISLARNEPYSSQTIEILNQVWQTINTGFSKILSEEEVRSFSVELIEKNKELEVLAKELQDQSGELLEQNVELEKQRKHVEKANQLKTEFLSNVSHELRTPLNSILALSKVLIKQTPDRLTSDESSYLEIVHRNGEQLLQLINDILDLSKIEAGQMELTLKTFSIKILIEDMVESLQLLTKVNNNDLKINLHNNLQMINSDQILIHRILQNLIGNALKFTENGRITISAEIHLDKLSIMVQDTGIGIPEESLPYIFEEFRQVDGSVSRSFDGTGLGLAIAQRTAKLLGGFISVESEVEKGSTFVFQLPVTQKGSTIIEQDDQLITETATEPGSSQNPVNKSHENIKTEIKTMLIIEDNPDNMATIKASLIGEYNIIEADDGLKGWNIIQSENLDIVLLDMMLPNLDGLTIAKRIKRSKELKSIPIIAVTAKAMKKDMEKMLSAGCNEIIIKPFNPDELNEKVNIWLEK